MRTHPVTGYNSLNPNSGFVDRIKGLNRHGSDKLLELLSTHVHTAIDYSVRSRWEKHSVALWDNRATTHCAAHDCALLNRHGYRVTISKIPVHREDSQRRREVEKALRTRLHLPAVYNDNLRNGFYPNEELKTIP